MAPFRVIIVGGSIAGLALANMLEQYGIDFLVLEKHPEIAPQVGAGFAIQPNGARILDQLGCYQELEDANEPVNTLTSFDEYSTSSRSKHDFGKWFEESCVIWKTSANRRLDVLSFVVVSVTKCDLWTDERSLRLFTRICAINPKSRPPVGL